MSRPPDEAGGGDVPWGYDEVHGRPEGVSDATVAAVGKVSEALEWLERARGRLYDLHQMLGHLDFQMGDAAEMLRSAGHSECGDLVDREVVGRNVLDGRWTFQVIEEFEAVYSVLADGWAYVDWGGRRQEDPRRRRGLSCGGDLAVPPPGGGGIDRRHRGGRVCLPLEQGPDLYAASPKDDHAVKVPFQPALA